MWCNIDIMTSKHCSYSESSILLRAAFHVGCVYVGLTFRWLHSWPQAWSVLVCIHVYIVYLLLASVSTFAFWRYDYFYFYLPWLVLPGWIYVVLIIVKPSKIYCVVIWQECLCIVILSLSHIKQCKCHDVLTIWGWILKTVQCIH